MKKGYQEGKEITEYIFLIFHTFSALETLLLSKKGKRSMNCLNFASILSIFGLLLISNGYSAPSESQPSDKTETEAVIEGNESNSTNGKCKFISERMFT